VCDMAMPGEGGVAFLGALGEGTARNRPHHAHGRVGRKSRIGGG
jgi:hypothetical protein